MWGRRLWPWRRQALLPRSKAKPVARHPEWCRDNVFSCVLGLSTQKSIGLLLREYYARVKKWLIISDSEYEEFNTFVTQPWYTYLVRRSTGQRGQFLPIASFMILTSVLLIYAVVNIYKVSRAKLEVQNL